MLLLGTLCLFAALLYLGALAHPVVLATLTVCLGCFAFAAWLAQWVLAKDEGPAEFAETSNAIRDGAEAKVWHRLRQLRAIKTAKARANRRAAKRAALDVSGVFADESDEAYWAFVETWARGTEPRDGAVRDEEPDAFFTRCALSLIHI